jgi:GrpB-like predicted nucleotidyltransferase (UPF0157 family)
MVGLKHGTVRLESYSPQWPKLYAREDKLLRRKLRPLFEDVQHIGSTAIPGLPAKPIIDIAIRVPHLAKLGQIIRALAELDYDYLGEYGLPGRHFFTKGSPVTHHAHVVAHHSLHWSRWLAFRDHLRENAADRDAYKKFKEQLAKKYARNRDAYTAGKDPFIERMHRRIEQKETKLT